jgi:hypothetical protein
VSPGPVLFVRPADDASAATLAKWGKRLLALFPDSFDDVSVGVDRPTIDAFLRRSPRALVWFGHGRPDALTSMNEAMVDSENVAGLAGQAIVAVACEAADELGSEALRQGVRGFLGFRRIVIWPIAEPGPVGEALVSGLSCLFKSGHHLGCARDKLASLFDRAADIHYRQAQDGGFSSLDGSPSHAMLAYMGALSNRDGLRVVGDELATL